MSRTKVMLVVAFLLVCVAGGVVGMALDRRVRPAPTGDGPFASLDLTDAQAQQMKAIWSRLMKRPDEMYQKHQQIDQQRNEAIRALLSPEQKLRYDQIQENHRRSAELLDNQMDQAFHDAEEQTRKILTPAQQVKFDEIRKKMGPHRHHRARAHSTTGPATNPTAKL
jgi:Spy/CpxP family protein refolding chaperone